MKNALKEPDIWGAEAVDELVRVLNNIDIPQAMIWRVQYEINSLADTLTSAVQIGMGDDI